MSFLGFAYGTARHDSFLDAVACLIAFGRAQQCIQFLANTRLVDLACVAADLRGAVGRARV